MIADVTQPLHDRTFAGQPGRQSGELHVVGVAEELAVHRSAPSNELEQRARNWAVSQPSPLLAYPSAVAVTRGVGDGMYVPCDVAVTVPIRNSRRRVGTAVTVSSNWLMAN